MRLTCYATYRSAFGQYKAGDVLDVSDEMGELLMRDSPGSFGPPSTDGPGEETASGVKAPDRRARGGRVRG